MPPTWDSAGSVVVPAWRCTGWGLPSRPVTGPLVRSYRTVSPLPAAPGGHIGGVLSVALSVGFPRLGVTQHPALWCPDFPHGARPRGCLACGGILPSSPVTPSIRAFLQVRAASSPQWLDGGARLAFLTGITGIPQAWAVPAAGGWPDQLTFGTERVGGLLATPDGRRPRLRARRRRRRAPPAAPRRARARAGRGRRDPPPRRLLARRRAPGLHAHGPQRRRLRPRRRRPRDAASAASSRSRAAGASRRRLDASAASSSCARSPTPTTRCTSSIRRPGTSSTSRRTRATCSTARRVCCPTARCCARPTSARSSARLAVLRDGEAGVPDAGHRRRRGDRGARRAARVDGQRGGLRPRHARRRPRRRAARRRPRRPRVLARRRAARAAPLAAGRHDRRVGRRGRPAAAPRHALGPGRAGGGRVPATRSSSASRASTASRCPTCATARATRRRSAGCTAGPESQERPALNAVVQYLVARGLTVAAPNVRGSTGYGRTYEHLDDVEQRLDSVADLAALARSPRRRARRAGRRHGRLLRRLHDARRDHRAPDACGGRPSTSSASPTSSPSWSAPAPTAGRCARRSTARWRRTASSWSRSRRWPRSTPSSTPLMVIHGANDPRVPVEEAEQIVAALRERGREVEYLRYEDEGHGLVRLPNRLDAYPKVAALPGAAPPGLAGRQRQRWTTAAAARPTAVRPENPLRPGAEAIRPGRKGGRERTGGRGERGRERGRAAERGKAAACAPPALAARGRGATRERGSVPEARQAGSGREGEGSGEEPAPRAAGVRGRRSPRSGPEGFGRFLEGRIPTGWRGRPSRAPRLAGWSQRSGRRSSCSRTNDGDPVPFGPPS